MSKEEIKDKLERLFSAGQYSIFKEQFFDTEIPSAISNVDELEDFDFITIWINNHFCISHYLQKGQALYANKFLFDLLPGGRTCLPAGR